MRDESLNKVRRMFKHYALLADKTNNERARTRTISQSNSAESRLQDIANLKEEIGQVYKLKSVNDQELIEANRRLTDAEVRLNEIDTERKSLKTQVTQMRSLLDKSKSELDELKSDNVVLSDEKNALMAMCTVLADSKMMMEKDRLQLLCKIRDLNEKHAEFMNAEVALQEKRRQLKIQEDVRRAVQDVHDDRSGSSMGAASPDSSSEDLLGDLVPAKAKFKITAHEGEVTDSTWINDTTFVTCGSDTRIRVWNSESQGKEQCSLSGMTAGSFRLDLDEQRRLILAAGADKTARLWNMDTQRLLTTLQGHSDKVSSARLHESHQVISGSFDRTIKIWDVPSGRCERSLFPGSVILDLVTGPPVFVSSHLDRTVRFWDPKQSSEPVKKVQMSHRVTSMDLSMDKTLLLCTTRDDVLTVLDVRNYQAVHNYSAENYKIISDLTRSVFSSTGEYVASGSANGCIFVWNTKTTRLETVLKGSHENPVLSVAWNPSGRGLISCERLKSVVFWK